MFCSGTQTLVARFGTFLYGIRSSASGPPCSTLHWNGLRKKIWADKLVLNDTLDRFRNIGDNLTCKLSPASQSSYIITNEPWHEKTRFLPMRKQSPVTAQLISAFVFARWIVQFLLFLRF